MSGGYNQYGNSEDPENCPWKDSARNGAETMGLSGNNLDEEMYLITNNLTESGTPWPGLKLTRLNKKQMQKCTKVRKNTVIW